MRSRIHKIISTLSALLMATAIMASSSLRTASQSGIVQDSTYERNVVEEFDSVVIDNPTGRTQAQTWNRAYVRVFARRETSGGIAIASEITLDRSKPRRLKIIVRAAVPEHKINLSVFLPLQINLSINGGDAPVSVMGATSSVSVETKFGAIDLRLPTNSNADISLRTIEGRASTNLFIEPFGKVDDHFVDGRINDGGVPVILRSIRGDITVSADDPSRAATLGGAGAAPIVAASSPRELNQTNPNSDGEPPPMKPANEPQPDDVVKIDTRLVSLNIRVTDQHGRLLPDLKLEDFTVVEDSEKQDVIHFVPVTGPVDVVLLIDMSTSTSDKLKAMKKAAKQFVDYLAPSTHIAIAAFTRRYVVISGFTDDRKLLKDRLDDLKPRGSGTAYYDAMWATINLLNEEKAKENRKAIVVLTDGVDNLLSSSSFFEPQHDFDELMARFSREDVTVYPIYFDTEYEMTVKNRSESHESYAIARKQLERVADDTGGTMFKANKAEDLEGVYQRVASELQMMYSVGYYPKDKVNDGRFRNVKVSVNRPNSTARTRRGYFAR